MSVRSFATAGGAFAVAGVVTAGTVIAPPLQARDVDVVEKTEVALAAQLTVPDAINVFFGVTPAGAYASDPPNPDGPPYLPQVTDSPGTAGATGVLYQMLANQVGADEGARAGLDAFFNGGFMALLQEYLAAYGADPLVQLFASGGFPAVAQAVLVAAFPGQAEIIDTFYSSGVTGLVHGLLNQIGPAETDELVNIFFNIDNPFGGDVPPALAGASGVTYALLNQIAPNPLTTTFFESGATGLAQVALLTAVPAEVQPLVNDFFAGGTSEVTRSLLLSRLPADSAAADLVNELFDNGVSGVVRYLLVGPAPEGTLPEDVVEEDLPDEPPGGGDYTRVAALDVDDTDVAPLAKKVESPEPPAAPAPAAPAAAAAAPAADPAADPAPAFTAKVRDMSVAEEKAAEAEELDGNKVEPEIIIGGGPNPGSGSWGVFGQIAQGVHDAIAGLSAPKPDAGPGPSPDAGAGDADGGEGGGDGGGEG